MKQFIALLRAVNVGRTGRVDMAELSALCQSAGFQHVESYINSGNLLFFSLQTREHVADALQGILESNFSLTGKRVALRTPEELQQAISLNPFTESASLSPQHLHVHFLVSPPRAEADLMLTSYKGPERIRRVGEQVYIHYPGGAGNSGLTSGFLEKALGSMGTSRNWNTCLELLARAKQKR